MAEIIRIEDIQTRIFKMRGQVVMLDRDLADLYNMRTIALRQQVKRNRDRFPDDFAFQLTKTEAVILVSQTVIPSQRSFGGSLPYVFTEEGVSMLPSVIRNRLAAQVHVAIMRAFVKMRHFFIQNRDLIKRLEKVENTSWLHETDIRLLVKEVEKLKQNPGPDGPITPRLI